jgi:hypothetical protein
MKMEILDIIVDYFTVFPYGNTVYVKYSLSQCSDDEIKMLVTDIINNNNITYILIGNIGYSYIYDYILNMVKDEFSIRYSNHLKNQKVLSNITKLSVNAQIFIPPRC